MYGPVCVRCGRRRARAGGNSVKRRLLSAVLGFHGCGLGWFSLAAFDDKLWPHLRIGRLKKQESETGSCQEPSRSSVLVRKRKVRTANAHRRQHGQHHASHRSDRRAYCSRWRLVRPGSLVLDLPLSGRRGSLKAGGARQCVRIGWWSTVLLAVCCGTDLRDGLIKRLDEAGVREALQRFARLDIGGGAQHRDQDVCVRRFSAQSPHGVPDLG